MAAIAEGELKVTYGTGAFLWMNAGAKPPASAAPGIIRTIAWQLDEPCYAYEGFVMYAGKILDWLRERLAIEGGGAAVAAASGESRNERRRAADPGLPGSGLALVAAVELRAAFLGLSEATTPGPYRPCRTRSGLLSDPRRAGSDRGAARQRCPW